MEEEKLSKEQILLIQQQIEEEKQFFRDEILSNYPEPQPDPFHTKQSIEARKNLLVEEVQDFMKKDIELALKSYFNVSSQEEREEIVRIIQKLEQQLLGSVGINDGTVFVTDEDCAFLETLAKRKISSEEYQEASSMFRLIVQLNGFFSGAWVGWAVSEQELGNLEVVEQIYMMGVELMPFDDYLVFFAADFFLRLEKFEKAILLLEQSKERLESEGRQDSESYREIVQALDQAKQVGGRL